MSSVIWYLYEFARKTWIDRFLNAKTDPEIAEAPSRFRDFPEVQKDLCISCGACVFSCPSQGAIKLVRDEERENIFPVINKSSCIRCGFCVEVCPTEPKTLKTGENYLIMEEYRILPQEKVYIADEYLCIRCKKCLEACKIGAINFKDNVISIDQSKCVSCGDCINACPVKGAIKETYIINIDEQKEIINTLIKSLEGTINLEVERIRKLPDHDPDKIIKLEYPLADYLQKARNIIPNDEMIIKTVEKVTDRLKMNIITWDDEKCNQCRLCVNECPTGAIKYDEKIGKVERDPEKCLRCTICYQTCPFGVPGLYVARFLLKNNVILITLKPSQIPIRG
ncbi:MAG: 4Fe-4S dicluster domain-containing protein [Euryarchaeota archaeon]|nr:4Fe-4S dicluster domain-containing protein [Euryarchaeota archaeon]